MQGEPLRESLPHQRTRGTEDVTDRLQASVSFWQVVSRQTPRQRLHTADAGRRVPVVPRPVPTERILPVHAGGQGFVCAESSEVSETALS